MSLASLDLNLLKALEALLTTESVSKAAAKLNVTQSAASHALARLRILFNDPLLVRVGPAMHASAKAIELRAPLERAMSDIQALMATAREFEPRSARRVFRLAMSDAMAVEGLPRIVRLVRQEAPGVDIVVETGGPVRSSRLLIDDMADVALGVFPAIPAELNSEELYRDQLVCIIDKDNPRLRRGRLSLKAFLDSPHVTVGQSSDSGIQLDDILQAMGMTRRIVASVPHYLAVPSLISGTDLVAHSRRKLINVFRSSAGLMVMPVPVPFPVPDLVFMQVWHTRRQHERAHVWLRDVVRRALAQAG